METKAGSTNPPAFPRVRRAARAARALPRLHLHEDDITESGSSSPKISVASSGRNSIEHIGSVGGGICRDVCCVLVGESFDQAGEFFVAEPSRTSAGFSGIQGLEDRFLVLIVDPFVEEHSAVAIARGQRPPRNRRRYFR